MQQQIFISQTVISFCIIQSTLMVWVVFSPTQDAPETPATDESKQNKESLDMNPLLNKQETDRREEETQPESMESQT